jgi:protein TonB
MSCDDRALIGGPPPRLPLHRWTGVAAQTAASATIHFVVLLVAVMLAGRASHSPRQPHDPPRLDTPVAVTRLVFIARGPRPSGGGGGGGNRQTKPVRRAEGNGRDTITLRIAKPSPVAERTDAIDAAPIPGVLLDARPLASGTRDIAGLPEGAEDFGTSLAPGSGGGGGTGVGTGIGSGNGPGVGAGSGGGTGGGIYRPGGNVTPPRVMTQVTPKYTEDALLRKIQGTVILEMVVTKSGLPDAIKVIGPLDPGGLDAAAVDAAKRWRFDPGRLAGTPVDVLVTLMLDFRIR